MEAAIRVTGLTKRYRKHTAVEDLDFDVPVGSVSAVMGNNGAGKSTTIRCLLGLEAADAGSISVLGMDPNKDSVGIRKQVGYVPEDRCLYEWMRATEIGRFVGSFYPTWNAELFDSILANFSVPTDRRISELSKGMKAQLDLALALASQPKLLILDEPTGGLDTLVRRDFMESMVSMAGDGRTVLVCSHEIHEIERVADHGMILFDSTRLWIGELEPLKSGTCEVRLPAGVPISRAGWEADDIVYQQADALMKHERVVVRKSPDVATQDVDAIDGAEVRGMNLEEIFTAMLRGAGDRRSVTA